MGTDEKGYQPSADAKMQLYCDIQSIVAPIYATNKWYGLKSYGVDEYVNRSSVNS